MSRYKPWPFRPRKPKERRVALATLEFQPSLRDDIFCWLYRGLKGHGLYLDIERLCD